MLMGIWTSLFRTKDMSMWHSILFSATGLALLLSVASGPTKEPPAPENGLPAGQWVIEFANGVVETCEIRKDGTASVSEPNRTSAGKAIKIGGAIVISFDDDRVERWTPIGQRMVVEHWAEGNQFPSGPAVRGIGEHPR